MIGGLGFALGALSAFAPERSIGFYQWIMKCYNWNVAPIDLPREIRNTRILGVVLMALSVATFVITFVRL
jgi:hypothetical protein